MKIPKKCKVKGCGRTSPCRGLCKRHYKYFNSQGYVKETTKSDDNKIEISGEIARIHLRNIRGETKNIALIDATDVELARKYKWHLASHKVRGKGMMNGKFYSVILVRLILGLKNNALAAKHLNGDSLDCRRKNLKVVGLKWLRQNVKLSKVNTSGHKGISWCKEKQKWDARLWCDGKTYRGGRHEDIQDAVSARKDLEEKYFKTRTLA